LAGGGVEVAFYSAKDFDLVTGGDEKVASDDFIGGDYGLFA
jgi:hypothetical protein